MTKFIKHLNEKLKNPEFKSEYFRQKQLSDLALKIQQARQKKGMSQVELAKLSGITQQQLSKIENAINSNILTYMKVLNALEYSFDVKPQKRLSA
ncbi:MAG: helix-turn-helix domain-containing protein [Spirochaetia bacterium]|nr:helix-turn-helix domain-containing protein [Spirochaetia bacterium]